MLRLSKYFIILIAVCLLVGQKTVFANESNYVYDQYSGKKIKINNYIFNINHASGEKTHLMYPYIDEEGDAIKKINAQIKYVMVGQLSTNAFYSKLDRYYSKSLENYIFYHANKEVNAKKVNMNIDQLSVIDYKANLVCDSIFSILVEYHFNRTENQTKLPSESEYYKNTYYESHFFNLVTGEEYQEKDLFEKSSQKQLNELVNDKIRAVLHQYNEPIKPLLSYNNVGIRINIEDEIALRKVLDNREKKLGELDILKEGLFYPLSSSMIYILPPSSQSSKYFTDRQIIVRISFEEIKEYINKSGPFNKIRYRTHNSTKLKNCDPSYSPLKSDFISYEINNYIEDSTTLKFKNTDSIYVYNLIKKDSLISKILLHKYKLNSQGSIVYYTFGDQIISCSYNEKEQLITHRTEETINNNVYYKEVDLTYDEQGNLIREDIESSEPGSEGPNYSKTFYTYYSEFILVEEYSNPLYYCEVSKIIFDKNQNRFMYRGANHEHNEIKYDTINDFNIIVQVRSENQIRDIKYDTRNRPTSVAIKKKNATNQWSEQNYLIEYY